MFETYKSLFYQVAAKRQRLTERELNTR